MVSIKYLREVGELRRTKSTPWSGVSWNWGARVTVWAKTGKTASTSRIPRLRTILRTQATAPPPSSLDYLPVAAFHSCPQYAPELCQLPSCSIRAYFVDGPGCRSEER